MHLILYGEKVEGILQTYDLRYQERKTKKQESHSIQTLFLKLSIDQTKQFFSSIHQSNASSTVKRSLKPILLCLLIPHIICSMQCYCTTDEITISFSLCKTSPNYLGTCIWSQHTFWSSLIYVPSVTMHMKFL